jgi:hypothetical protein
MLVHDGGVEPNLIRIPAGADAQARRILSRVPGMIGPAFLESLDKSDFSALGRYGARQPTIALRERSPDRLYDALLAAAICRLGSDSDPRDAMVGLAVHFVVAERIGISPSAMFGTIAARLPDGPVADLLRTFGARDDVTLEAFGWELVQTADGQDFMPA